MKLKPPLIKLRAEGIGKGKAGAPLSLRGHLLLLITFYQA
jgi:hypothetical protein